MALSKIIEEVVEQILAGIDLDDIIEELCLPDQTVLFLRDYEERLGAEQFPMWVKNNSEKIPI